MYHDPVTRVQAINAPRLPSNVTGVLLVVLMLVTYVPSFSMWLPNLILK